MKIERFMNHLKIKTKLIFVYGLCVLLPLVLTDTLVLIAVRDNAIKEQEITMNYRMDRIQYNIQGAFNDCVNYAKRIYKDQRLNDFLVTKYPTPRRYFQDYYTLMESNFLFTEASSWEGATIYTSNETILNGGNFIKSDLIKDREWYLDWVKNGYKPEIFTYYEKLPYTYYYGSGKMISLLYPMNYYKSEPPYDLIKVDLDYEKLLADLINEKFDGTVYVCDYKRILLSNKRIDSKVDYASRSRIDWDNIKFFRSMDVMGQFWDILIEVDDISLWKELKYRDLLIPMIVVNMLLPSIFLAYIGKTLTKRLKLMSIHMGKMKKEIFEPIELDMDEDEIGELIQSYNLMVAKIKNLIEVVYRENSEKQLLELSKKEAELKALQSQVNPHFFFNTLETIRMRSLIKGEEETADIIGEVSLVFRTMMDWREELHTIEEEMSFVLRYLKIQKYRFAERIQFSTQIMEKCKSIKIPKLSIVTFIENACVHGVEERIEPCMITLKIEKNSDFLFISIEDTGIGVEADKLDQIRSDLNEADIKKLFAGTKTGVLNTYIRLKMLISKDTRIEIASRRGEGTKVHISIPFKEV